MIVLSPADRYAFVGKTGSGKTFAAVVIACILVAADAAGWEVWWLDSKLDPRDADMLRRWGFGRKDVPNRKHVRIDPSVNGMSVEDQVQLLCHRALHKRNVLVVIDEYKHVVLSTRRAGSGIEGVHLRGRGLHVGMIGQTQEPVEIPRQLLSQATHIFLFDLSYATDIAYMRKFFPGYKRPPDAHGFWHCHVDGDAEWRYYPHIKAWHDVVTSKRTRPNSKQAVSA